ncbi:hypothetical protein [Thalassotalea sp. G2M2-11]|uniref:hypothetical protein n=1 Tax=Thalassotalea sp. G2M2-11 TaxID=2787627 RepID=UPI0019CF836E|nr:hypothetical protein [Thalassotalea sp. G2M2-11]
MIRLLIAITLLISFSSLGEQSVGYVENDSLNITEQLVADEAQDTDWDSPDPIIHERALTAAHCQPEMVTYSEQLFFASKYYLYLHPRSPPVTLAFS